MVPLVIAPTCGVLDTDGGPVTVQRTFATARSTEFDAILVAGAPAPGADAYGARDAKVDDDLVAAAGFQRLASVSSGIGSSSTAASTSAVSCA